MVKTYPWTDILSKMDGMDPNKIQFNPSLEFTDIETTHSFTLTAHREDHELAFSLWYKRPVKKKILFGLLGETTKMRVVDKWSFDLLASIVVLKQFLNREYVAVEEFMAS